MALAWLMPWCTSANLRNMSLYFFFMFADSLRSCSWAARGTSSVIFSSMTFIGAAVNASMTSTCWWKMQLLFINLTELCLEFARWPSWFNAYCWYLQCSIDEHGCPQMTFRGRPVAEHETLTKLCPRSWQQDQFHRQGQHDSFRFPVKNKWTQ